MGYHTRIIDAYLQEWSHQTYHKPILLRGARQVGKSSAVRNLGKSFKNFVEINFEKNPEYKEVFVQNLDVGRIVSQLSLLSNQNIKDQDTLLFFDEIQECKEAIMSLRFFKEERPGLHVIAAGSLLEFALEELPTFGVGRIHSMFMYPMTFDEYLMANGENQLIEIRNQSTNKNPLPDILHKKLVNYFRNYIIIGGMPEVVDRWVKTHDYLSCQEIQDDILLGYEDDFSKYRKKVDPTLLRNTFRSAANQLTEKFTYSSVVGNYKSYEVKKALSLLIRAGLLVPVVRTYANGLPLGAETDESYKKILVLDSGLTLRLLQFTTGDITHLISDILNLPPGELVNKGSLTEMIAGLEILRYSNPNLRHEIFYWIRQEKNATAEVDYVISTQGKILPIEIKSGVQGGMKSMWIFMDTKDVNLGVRSSLENFGLLVSPNKDTDKRVLICPLYGLSQLARLLTEINEEG
ncbi:MAG: AAA family ATPase [Muribaculaceae bacterium]|nr:AAA family ATPase [Muribaculaceae bacterium]